MMPMDKVKPPYFIRIVTLHVGKYIFEVIRSP